MGGEGCGGPAGGGCGALLPGAEALQRAERAGGVRGAGERVAARSAAARRGAGRAPCRGATLVVLWGARGGWLWMCRSLLNNE